MMRVAIGTLVVMSVLVFALPGQSATVLKLTFDSAAVVDDATYDFAAGDIPASGTVTRYFRGASGPARDFGCLQPDPCNETGNYPDIVSATPGFQGGNSMFTALGTVADPQEHVGWYVDRNNGIVVTGDFTAEVIFMVNKIGTVSDPVEGCEYSLQNIFGTDMIEETANWDFRLWPIGIIGGYGQLQLHLGGVGGAGEVNITTTTGLNAQQWYHAAIVYTAATNTAEFFLDGVSIGTNTPNWGSDPKTQNDWWIGAWPSNGANRGMAGWIDAVAISDEVLDPNHFVLPRAGYAPVESWSEY